MNTKQNGKLIIKRESIRPLSNATLEKVGGGFEILIHVKVGKN